MRASTLSLVLLLGLGCNDEPPAPPPKEVKKGVDVAKIPVPDHTPEMLSDPGKPRRVSSPGSLDVQIDGKHQHFVHMPKGVNAAVRFDDKDVAWIRVTGQATTESGPWVRIELRNVRLDELEFPATFTTRDKGKAKLAVRYEMDPTRYWETKSGVESDNVAELTLESFEGKKLTGTFKGTLDPADTKIAKPMPITSGKFQGELRLNGVSEKTKAADGPS
jgi:hypothetical protein